MAGSDQASAAAGSIAGDLSQTVENALINPSPIAELALAVVILVGVITVHGWCINYVTRWFSVRIDIARKSRLPWRVNLVMGVTVALLALTHLIETVLWAAPLWQKGLIADFRSAYLFTLEAYTTLGETDIRLPEGWRLVGPVIAITGLFTFSWTGSVLVYVMTEVGRFHAHRPTAVRNPHRTASAASGTDADDAPDH